MKAFSEESYFTVENLDTVMKTDFDCLWWHKIKFKARIHSFHRTLAPHPLTFEYVPSASLYTKK